MDFKEFERKQAEQADKPAEQTQEAQETKEVQEPLTPEEIDQAGEELHQAAQRAARLINPEASERDAHNFAHTPFFSDYLDGMENPDKYGSLRPEYKGIAADLKQAAQEAQEALNKWETIKRRFYQSEQWHKLQAAFTDITPEQAEILLNTPAFIWQIIDALPEILEEAKAHEKATGRQLTFKDLLQAAGDIPDAETPREMLLSVLLTRADKKKNIAAAQISGELSKYHIAPVTALTTAIRGGLIGAGPHDITIRNESKRAGELTIYGQLYFSLDGEIVDPTETRPAAADQTGQETFIISDELREIIKVDGQHTGADDVNREAIYTKILNAENSGRDWRQLQFTATNIWKEKNHTTKEPSAQAKGAVTKSIEKQRHLFADIDLTAYAKMGVHFYNPETGRQITEYNDRFLKLARFKEQGNYYFYRLTSYPIELLIAKQLKQIISYPAALLEVHEVTPAGEITPNIIDVTEERTAIITNLYRIIYNMKYQLNKARDSWRKGETRRQKAIAGGKATEEDAPARTVESYLPAAYRQQFRILFDTLFQDAGIDPDGDRSQLQRHRDFVFNTLDYCKAYQHQGEPIIKDYSIVKGGRGGKIRGVDIEL